MSVRKVFFAEERQMNKLRKQRRMLAWTQHQLARAAGIAPGRISFWETGRVTLTDEELERVKRALAKRAEEITSALAVA
jgi:DNA-binding XRE family transcriptional regulator